MEFEHGYQSCGENHGFAASGVAYDLATFMLSRYDSAYPGQETQPVLGLFLAGYSDKSFFPEEYVLQLPQERKFQRCNPDQEDGRPTFAASWWGQTDALTRLIKGFAVEGLNDLVERGVDRQIVQEWADEDKFRMPLILDGMPLQDAVDLAEYLVQVVVGRFRFGAGPPLCGGDVDIAVITPGKYEWARQKRWSIKVSGGPIDDA